MQKSLKGRFHSKEKLSIDNSLPNLNLNCKIPIFSIKTAFPLVNLSICSEKCKKCFKLCRLKKIVITRMSFLL